MGRTKLEEIAERVRERGEAKFQLTVTQLRSELHQEPLGFRRVFRVLDQAHEPNRMMSAGADS